MKKKYFGTDGIRGRVGSEKIHPEFIMKLGWALGSVLNQSEHKKVIIGKDTRISGYMFESALEAGFSAAGVDVRLVGPMPTPAIAYLTQTFRAHAGVVISASHNPYQDNGIKFFDANGEKLADALEIAIEAALEKPFELQAPHLLGKASRINDANGRYIEFCKSTISSKLRLNGLKIVLDCANGATYRVAPSVFKELGAELVVIGDKPDGFNINQACGSTHPEQLQAKVLAAQADLGIGFDGDGDRVIMVDSKGQIVNGDGVLYLIAKDRFEQNKLQGGVVGTLMSNIALELKFKAMQIPFIRTDVGDRNVMAELKKNNWLIGGETSGHIVCLDKTTTGDGIIAALQVLAKMVREQQSLETLMSDIQFFPQVMLNIKTSNALELMKRKDVCAVIQKHQDELQGRGRILVRPSGTEPLLRILMEGPEEYELLNIKKDIEQVFSQTKAQA
jgi:phosphoglucosamine mutase